MTVRAVRDDAHHDDGAPAWVGLPAAPERGSTPDHPAAGTFWALCALPLVPVAVVVDVLVRVGREADWPPGLWPAEGTVASTFGERWSALLGVLDLGWLCALAAVAALVPAVLVGAGRPGPLLPPGRAPRVAAAGVAAATGCTALAVSVLAVWTHLRDRTPWEDQVAALDGVVVSPLQELASSAGTHVVALVLCAAAVVCALDRGAPAGQEDDRGGC